MHINRSLCRAKHRWRVVVFGHAEGAEKVVLVASEGER